MFQAGKLNRKAAYEVMTHVRPSQQRSHVFATERTLWHTKSLQQKLPIFNLSSYLRRER